MFAGRGDMKVLGFHIGAVSAQDQERAALRAQRADAHRKAMEARGQFIDELARSIIVDVKRKPLTK